MFEIQCRQLQEASGEQLGEPFRIWGDVEDLGKVGNMFGTFILDLKELDGTWEAGLPGESYSVEMTRNGTFT